MMDMTNKTRYSEQNYGEELKCTVCGGAKFTKNGTRLDRKGRWQMYQCQGCGHRQKGELIRAHLW